MINHFTARHSRRERAQITIIPAQKAEIGIRLSIRQKLPPSGGKVVPPENLMPISQKPVAEIAANESRRTCDENFHLANYRNIRVKY